MNFSIDPKDLNLQDAAGMQLVEVIRNLADESGTMDYEDLENLPKINGVTLTGDKSSDDLHIAVSGEQLAEAVDAWLQDNVDPDSGYVLDSTLTMSNAAAPANLVGEIKEGLDDITETVVSKNIFDQANATVVEGKYLNPNNGNEGTNEAYCYVSDYIPVDANTKYYGSVWNKTNGSLKGEFGGFVIFYESDKTYISGLSGASGQNPFTTPNDCAYMRISISINAWESSNFMFEKGETNSAVYVPYFNVKTLKQPFIVVDANGNGQFTSIDEAVQIASAGDIILVSSGVYNENVKAWGKEVHIIGLSRESCIIQDDSGNYNTPPLEIGAGSIQNMTIIEKANGSGSAANGAYAIHVEDNNLENKKLLIRNCYVYSDSSSAIGIGLRGGCSVRIENCEIICAGARASTGAAPIYMHDADASAYWGTANFTIKNCVLRNLSSSLYSMLTINSIHAENTTYLHFMYNILVRSATPSASAKFNTWNSAGNTSADGWNGLSHMYLEDDSFGNNLTELNYSAE